MLTYPDYTQIAPASPYFADLFAYEQGERVAGRLEFEGRFGEVVELVALWNGSYDCPVWSHGYLVLFDDDTDTELVAQFEIEPA